MRKSLLMALVVAVPFLMGHSKEVSKESKESELETSNLKPHEQVQKYLAENRLAKQNFIHYFFLDTIEREVHYNKSYDFGDKVFIEQYDLSGERTQDKNKKFLLLGVYPSMFSWRGIWYIDPHRDGFNGNEIKHSDWLKEFPEPRKPVEYTPKKGLRI